MKALLIIFVTVIPIFAEENIHQIKNQIIQFRLNHYQDTIPSINELNTLYQITESITDENEKLLLNIYFGISLGELLLYSQIDSDLEDVVTKIYTQSRKKIKKFKSSDLLQKMGEFSLIMTKFEPAKKMKYYLDARMLFMEALMMNKNNVKAKIGLGKWWALNIIQSTNREYNHALSQAEKYLSDKEIIKLQNQPIDEWDNIDLVNIYYIRSLVRMKSLSTEKSYVDLQNAKTLFPNFVLTDLLSNLYDQNTIAWI